MESMVMQDMRCTDATAVCRGSSVSSPATADLWEDSSGLCKGGRWRGGGHGGVLGAAEGHRNRAGCCGGRIHFSIGTTMPGAEGGRVSSSGKATTGGVLQESGDEAGDAGFGGAGDGDGGHHGEQLGGLLGAGSTLSSVLRDLEEGFGDAACGWEAAGRGRGRLDLDRGEKRRLR